MVEVEDLQNPLKKQQVFPHVSTVRGTKNSEKPMQRQVSPMSMQQHSDSNLLPINVLMRAAAVGNCAGDARALCQDGSACNLSRAKYIMQAQACATS